MWHYYVFLYHWNEVNYSLSDLLNGKKIMSTVIALWKLARNQFFMDYVQRIWSFQSNIRIIKGIINGVHNAKYIEAPVAVQINSVVAILTLVQTLVVFWNRTLTKYVLTIGSRPNVVSILISDFEAHHLFVNCGVQEGYAYIFQNWNVKPISNQFTNRLIDEYIWSFFRELVICGKFILQSVGCQ